MFKSRVSFVQYNQIRPNSVQSVQSVSHYFKFAKANNPPNKIKIHLYVTRRDDKLTTKEYSFLENKKDE